MIYCSGCRFAGPTSAFSTDNRQFKTCNRCRERGKSFSSFGNTENLINAASVVASLEDLHNQITIYQSTDEYYVFEQEDDMRDSNTDTDATISLVHNESLFNSFTIAVQIPLDMAGLDNKSLAQSIIEKVRDCTWLVK